MCGIPVKKKQIRTFPKFCAEAHFKIEVEVVPTKNGQSKVSVNNLMLNASVLFTFPSKLNKYMKPPKKSILLQTFLSLNYVSFLLVAKILQIIDLTAIKSKFSRFVFFLICPKRLVTAAIQCG